MRFLVLFLLCHQVDSQWVSIAAGKDASKQVQITWSPGKGGATAPADRCGSSRPTVTETTGTKAAITIGSNQPTCVFLSKPAYTNSFGKSFEAYESHSIYRLALDNLNPGTAYEFTADGLTGSFTTLTQSTTYPLKIGVIADTDQNDESQKTVEEALKLNPAILLDCGDMSYADANMAKWETYKDKMKDHSRKIQWMVIAGNHEYFEGRPGLTATEDICFEAYDRFFWMPGHSPSATAGGVCQPAPAKKNEAVAIAPTSLKDAEAGKNGNILNSHRVSAIDRRPTSLSGFVGGYPAGLWNTGNSYYSFTAGPVFVLALNSYVKSDASSAQYKWVQEQLEAVNRATTPWVIVMMHSTFYQTNVDHNTEGYHMRDNLEALFNGKVALVISGHVHAYERTTVTKGPTYIVIGNAGRLDAKMRYYRKATAPQSGGVNTEARGSYFFGFGMITVISASELTWKVHRTNSNTKVLYDVDTCEDGTYPWPSTLPRGDKNEVDKTIRLSIAADPSVETFEPKKVDGTEVRALQAQKWITHETDKKNAWQCAYKNRKAASEAHGAAYALAETYYRDQDSGQDPAPHNDEAKITNPCKIEGTKCEAAAPVVTKASTAATRSAPPVKPPAAPAVKPPVPPAVKPVKKAVFVDRRLRLRRSRLFRHWSQRRHEHQWQKHKKHRQMRAHRARHA